MDSSTSSQSDPLILLLSEIEVLLAQIRLMELHLKRAEAASIDQRARLQGQYQEELKALRTALAAAEENLAAQKHAELAELRSALETRDQVLREHQSAALEIEHRLKDDALKTREELEQQRALAAACDEQLRDAHARVAALEQRADYFEAASQRIAASAEQLDSAHRSQETEIATLRHQVATQERALTERQEAVTAVELALHSKIQSINQELARSRREIEEQRAGIDELRLQVVERQLLVESRAAEIESLKTSVTRLSAQLAQQQAIESETKPQFVNEVEATQAAHRTEIGALQEERRVERQTLENELAQERQNSADLQRQILELKDRHRETEALLKSRAQDAAAETATPRGPLEQLESLRETERTVQANAEQLAELREELQDKAWSLARQQAAIENLALAHKNQLQKLDTRIDEQQRAIDDRDSELEKARAQTQSLGRRIEELQDELQKTERTALNGSQQLDEEQSMNTEDRNKQSAESGTEIERRASDAELEQTLRDEIGRLRREAQEKNQILRDRNDELVHVKAQFDGLHERLNQLESSTFETASTFDGESERMRTEFQAQLALLQAELSQKEWALEERQAKSRGMEQALRQEIELLRRQLAESETVERQATRDFVFDEPRSSDAQDPRLEIAGNATATSSFAGHRRWNTGFGWKRRWRS